MPQQQWFSPAVVPHSGNIIKFWQKVIATFTLYQLNFFKITFYLGMMNMGPNIQQRQYFQDPVASQSLSQSLEKPAPHVCFMKSTGCSKLVFTVLKKLLASKSMQKTNV